MMKTTVTLSLHFVTHTSLCVPQRSKHTLQQPHSRIVVNLPISYVSASSSSSPSLFLQQMESTLKQQLHQKKKKWFLLLITSLFLLSLLIILSIFVSHDLSSKPTESQKPIFVESKLRVHTVPSTEHRVPRLAYLISGSIGDGESLKRTLKALYHPLNQYVVHLDLEASAAERMDLLRFVEGDAVFREIENVRVVVRSNLVTYRGPTMVSNTLHAAAILLKEGGDWDWFINLSASDYPLVTQDDLLHTLSSVPRHLNFIEHTSDIGWKEFQRAKPVIIDPGLYSLQKSDVFWISEKRSVPSAFKLFTAPRCLHGRGRKCRSRGRWCTERVLNWRPGGGLDLIVDDGGDASLLIHEGVKVEYEFAKSGKVSDPNSTDILTFRLCLMTTSSAWMMLSRSFIDYCIWGWDSLPRVVLMYYANFLSSPEGYFHTVICNADEFRNTTVSHDLHFISWDNPPKQHPHFLTTDDFQRMVDSNAPFARKFGHNEAALERIDKELLGRSADGFVHGGWFGDGNTNSSLPSYIVKNTTNIRPGAGAERIQRLISGLLSDKDFHGKQCV
ncbi:hypothetical protein Scep_024215 [Stephania cephalantha]|uniref:Uncharacterized protein n=1 Tax=Stephania cephalantha TaxID=152367 RepID=A0AAP0HY88_9MAGN